MPLIAPPLMVYGPPVTLVREMPLAPPVEVTLAMPAPLVRATPLRTRARFAPLIVLFVPPSVPPPRVTMSAPAVALPVMATLLRLSVPVKAVVVPSMAFEAAFRPTD